MELVNTNDALLFLALQFSLCIVPSPEMVMVLTHSSISGFRAGFTFVLGLCVALLFQVVLMAFGITAILQTSNITFATLKIAGVCYLLYLSFITLKIDVNSMKSKPKYNSYLTHGFIMNVSNPMNPLYLLLVFPSFVTVGSGSIFFQNIQLGLLMIAVILIMFSFYSVVGKLTGEKILESKKVKKYFRVLAAITIAVFAVILALSTKTLD